MSKKVTEPTTNSFTTNGNAKVILPRSSVPDFFYQIMTVNFITNVMTLYQNPIDNIKSLIIYPFDVKTYGYPTASNPQLRNDLTINRVTLSNIPNYEMNPYTPPLLDLGGATISKYFNSFLDYAPYTKIEMYLPFFGFITLDNNLVMGKYVSIKYGVDYDTGTATAYIQVSTDSTLSDAVLLETRQFKIGINISLVGGAENDYLKSALSAGMHTIANASTGLFNAATGAMAMESGSTMGGGGSLVGGVYQFGTSVTDFFTNAKGALDYKDHRIDATDTQNAIYMPMNVYMIITRPNVYYPPDYNHMFGKPTGYTFLLDQLSGYTEIAQMHIEGSDFVSALKEEREEIERLLKSGVMLGDPPSP